MIHVLNQTSEISQMNGFLDVSVFSVPKNKHGITWTNVRINTWTELGELNSINSFALMKFSCDFFFFSDLGTE